MRTMLFDTTTATAKTHVTKAKKRKKKLSQWMADMVSKLLRWEDGLHMQIANCTIGRPDDLRSHRHFAACICDLQLAVHFRPLALLRRRLVRLAGSRNPPRRTNIETIVPTSMIEASGTQYFRQVVITWSMRSRGSVQRSHIMKITPRKPLTTRLHMPRKLPRKPATAPCSGVSPSMVGDRDRPVPAAAKEDRAEQGQQEHGTYTRP